MDYLLFFISAVLAVWLFSLKRFSVTPVTFFSGYLLVSLLIFFTNDKGIFYFEEKVGLPVEMLGGYLYAGRVYLTCFLLFLGLTWIGLKTPRQNNVSDISIDVNAILNGFRSVFIVLALFLLLIFMWHSVEVDFGPMLKNHLYLLNVNPPNVGLKTSVGVIGHHLTGPGGLILAFLFAYFLRERNYPLVLICFVCLAYALFIKSAQFSRWAPLIMVAIGLSLILMSRSRGSVVGYVVLFVSYIFLVNVLNGRSSPIQGFVGFVDNLYVINPFSSKYLMELLTNIFGGLIISAESFEVYHRYEFSYIWRSFSILPSALDGWREYYMDAGRINHYAPFNVFAELYCFGIFYEFGALFFLLLTMYRIESRFNSAVTILKFLPFIVLLYFITASFFYPIRNVFRVYLVAWLCFEGVAVLELKIASKFKKLS